MTFRPTRRQILAASGAALWTGMARAQGLGAAPVVSMQGTAFASTWRVSLPSGKDPEALRAPLDAMLAGIDRMMSPWRADSEITAFNRAREAAAVSPETALVAQAALDVATASDGWFDPTVGPLVAKWGFGEITGAEGARWQGLSVAGDSLCKDAPGLTMDLCGIAKGRALDLMAELLIAEGHEHFLIDLGGELRAGGLHPEGRPWQVAIEDPRGGAAAGLQLQPGMAVATSGTSQQSYVLGGQTYSHIVDPHNAAPATSQIASVTVMAHDAMTADAWATALTAAGNEGIALAEAQGLTTGFLIHEGNDLRLHTTGGFDRHLI